MAPKRHGLGALTALLAATVLLSPAAGAASREEADRLAGPSPGGVTGRVMTADSRSIAGVRVTLRRGDASQTTETDKQGEYCFCRVPPGKNYVLSLEKEGFANVVEKDFFVGRRKISILNVILRPSSGSGAPVVKEGTP